MPRAHFYLASAAVAALALTARVALAYDLGCQYFWTEPSEHNDVIECLKRVPTDNGGVLIPPIIPLVFVVLMLLVFPVVFCTRCCCGAFGSNKMRPGADCCCDGEEWDEIPVDEKAAVYPRKHVCCIKVLCLLVVVACAVPIILMPIGGKKGIEFWDDFQTSANRDIIDWAQDLKDGFIADLTLSNGSLPAQMDISTFDNLQQFIDDGRKFIGDVKTFVDDYVDVFNLVIMIVSFVPLVLAACMLLFILLSIRRVVPAICMWVYWVVALLFGLVSTVMMVLGVVFMLMSGEVELQQWKAPGAFQWYLVPYCEGQSMFRSIKDEFTNADRDQSEEVCRKFMEFCDDLAWSSPAVAGVSSEKPFKCSLTNDNVADSCPTIYVAAELINSTFMKPDAPAALCPSGGCTVGNCPTECAAGDARDTAESIAEAFDIGLKIAGVVDRAFLYADCDVLLTQAIKPLTTSSTGAMGAFLAAAGTGFGALFLMFGMLLLCKGQKLFFSKPKKGGYGDDMDIAERGGGRRRAANDGLYEMGQMSTKPVD